MSKITYLYFHFRDLWKTSSVASRSTKLASTPTNHTSRSSSVSTRQSRKA